MKKLKAVLLLSILFGTCIINHAQASDDFIIIDNHEIGQEEQIEEVLANNTQIKEDNSDEAYVEDVEENYVFISDFFAAEGAAEEAIQQLPSDVISSIEFLNTTWQGSQYEFLADMHYAFATYENADIEYIEWNAYTLIDGIETPYFQLSNGEIIYLRIQKNGEYAYIQSPLPGGVYEMTITNESGNVYASTEITITDKTATVAELQFGMETIFTLSPGENKVFSLDFQSQDNIYDKSYPVYLSSEKGDYYVQCLWDNNGRITNPTGNGVLVASGENSEYPYTASEEGKAFFLIKSMSEGETSGTIRITLPNELKQIEAYEYTQQVFCEDVMCDDTYDPSDTFSLSIMYEDSSIETLRNWTKSNYRNCYYKYTASGKPIYIYLKDKDLQKVKLPSSSDLPEAGMYYWSVEYQVGYDTENTVLSTYDVEFQWGIERNNLNNETATFGMEEDQIMVFTTTITDTMVLKTDAVGDEKSTALLESSLYTLQDNRWIKDKQFVCWNGEEQYTLLEAGDYVVFLKALGNNDVSLSLEKDKIVKAMTISDQMPEELSFSQLLSDPDKYLPSENVSVLITYDDDSSEELTEWALRQDSYVATTKYGKEITMVLDNSTVSSHVIWGEGCIPAPGSYCWVANIDEVTASSKGFTIIDDAVTEIDLNNETELGSKGLFAAKFDIEEDGKYQIRLSFETEKDEEAIIYRFSNGTFLTEKKWLFEDEDIIPASLQEGQYYIAISNDQELPGTILITKSETVEMLSMTGLDQITVNEIIDAYESMDEDTEDVNELSLKGLALEIKYENGSTETINMAANDYFLRLSNGEILSFGVVDLDDNGNPVLVKGYGAKKYYELGEYIKHGSYALIGIIGDEPYLTTYIPFVVKLPEGLFEIPESYSTLNNEGTSIISVSEENPQTFIKVSVEKTAKYVMYSDADNTDTVARLYKYDDDSEILIPVASDDDGGKNNNFRLVYELKEGNTYYLECGTYEEETANYTVYFKEKTITISDESEEDVSYTVEDLPETFKLTVEAETSKDTDLSYQWFIINDDNEYEMIDGANEKTLTIEDPKTNTYYCEISDGNDTDGVHKYVFIDNQFQINVASEICADENGNVSITINAMAQNGNLMYYWEESKYDSESEEGYFIPLSEQSNQLLLNGITETRYFNVTVTDMYNNKYSRLIFVYDKHDWKVISTEAPTCTQNGITKFECLNCWNEKEETIPALGHQFGNWIIKTPASNQSTGIQIRTCSTCGEVETQIIPKLVNSTSAQSNNSSPQTVVTEDTSNSVTEKITISKKPTIKKPTATKNNIIVKWSHFKYTTKKNKAIWEKIKKVQIQCAADKAFKNIVKTTTVGKSKKKATIKGLKNNTTYFVRVRYSDSIGFSKWSSVKKVKTKKQ